MHCEDSFEDSELKITLFSNVMFGNMWVKVTSRKYIGNRLIYKFSSSLFLKGSKLLFKLFSLVITRPIMPLTFSQSRHSHSLDILWFLGHSLSTLYGYLWKIPVDLSLETPEELHLPQSNPPQGHFT